MRHILNHLVVATAFTTAGLALLLANDIGEAHACNWGHGHLEWVVPADGAEVPQNVHFALGTVYGFDPEFEFELLDGDDNTYPLLVENFRTAQDRFPETNLYVITPEELLEPGPYTLTLSTDTYFRRDGESQNSYSLDVIVTDAEFDAPSAPNGLHWTHTDYPPDDCWSHHPYKNEVDAHVDEVLDNVWYEVSVPTDNGDTKVGFVADNPASFHTDHALDCVSLEAVSIDGSRSEPIEHCTPDVCLEGNLNGEDDEYDCNPDPQADNSADNSAGCSSTQGYHSPLPLIVALIALTMTARIRQTAPLSLHDNGDF